MRLFALALVAACGTSEPAPPQGRAGTAASGAPTTASGKPDILKGSIVVDGETLVIARCQPRHDGRTFVELETAKGVLRFKEMKLSWKDEVLTCERLDRSWGGGVRPDGSAYWRGTLDFACGAITGKVEADCGRITDAERTSLDAQRRDLQDQQARDKPAGN